MQLTSSNQAYVSTVIKWQHKDKNLIIQKSCVWEVGKFNLTPCINFIKVIGLGGENKDTITNR